MKNRLKTWLPKPETLQSNRWLRWMGPVLNHPRLWHFSRKGIALGLALGIFFGLLIPVAQIPFAATLAVVLLGPWRAFAGAPEGAVPLGWTTVTVVPGATLWEMAQSLDPAADPRAIIAEIKAANGLTGSQLSPGQVLLVPSS